MKIILSAVFFCSALFAGFNCSLLEFDREQNCLNPQAACFKSDTTSPSIAASVPAAGSSLSVLPQIDITFSEELRNMLDTSEYSFSGTGGTNLNIASVTALDKYSVRLTTTGQVINGPIVLNINLNDYNGNALTDSQINLTGNVNIGIIIQSVSNEGTSSTGFTQTEIIWHHDYIQDNANTWAVKAGGTSCETATALPASQTILVSDSSAAPAELPADTEVKTVISHSDLPDSGLNDIRICAENAGQNKEGSAVTQILKDTSAPVTVATPGNGTYPAVQSVSLNCTDNCLKTAYTLDGSDPAFDSAGNITTGNEYTGAISTPHDTATQPTTTEIRFLSIDKAGNVEGPIKSETYIIDDRVPSVTLTSSGGNYVNGSSAITYGWQSDQPGAYDIIYNGSCPSSSAGSLAENDGSVSNPNNLTVNGADLTTGANTVSICVLESNTNTYVGAYSFTLYRDDSAPTFSGIQSIVRSGSPSGSELELNWAAASDDSPVEYLICRSEVQGQCTTSFTATETVTTQGTTLTGLDPEKVYYVTVRARDLAGNTDTNTAEEQSAYTIKIARTDSMTGSLNLSLSVDNETRSLSLTESGGTADSGNFGAVSAGQFYRISTSGGPSGTVCALAQPAYGVMPASSDVNLNIACRTGQLTAGRFRTRPPQETAFHLYRALPNTIASPEAPDGITAIDRTLYYTDSSLQGIEQHNIDTDTETPLLNNSGLNCDTALNTNTLYSPMGLTSDGNSLYVSDHTLHRIFKVETDGTVHLLAGKGTQNSTCDTAYDGSYADHSDPFEAEFNSPGDLELNNKTLYILDYGNDRIRTLNIETGRVETLAGSGTDGCSTGSAENAQFSGLLGLAYDSATNRLYASDVNCDSIFSINLNLSPSDNSFVTRLINSEGSPGHTDGTLSHAAINNPAGLESDNHGNLYFTEYTGSSRLRRYSSKTGRVTTLAGKGWDGFATGSGIVAAFNRPRNLLIYRGIIYLSDTDNNRVRRITDSGLSGYWPLASNNYDYSGNGNDLTTTGTVTSANGRYNESSGARTTVNGNLEKTGFATSTLPVANTDSTICAWVKPSTLNYDTTYTVVNYGQYGTAGEHRALSLYRDSNGVKYLAFDINDFNNHRILAPITISTDTWSHICALYDGPQLKLYHNGRAVGFDSYGGPLNTKENNITIGTALDNNHSFSGAIADVRIYSRILNDAEINTLAQMADSSLVENFNNDATGLLSLYPLNGFSDTENTAVLRNLGLINGGSNGSGKNGDNDGSLVLNENGTGEYARAVNPDGLPTGDAPRTMCAWLRPYSYPTTRRYAAIYGSHAIDQSFAIGLLKEGGEQKIVNNFFGNENSQPYRMSLNTWQHLCAVYTGSHSQLYVNGEAVGSPYAVTLNTGTEKNFFIGRSTDPEYYFHGAIDEVRVYNHALTAAQLKRLSIQIPEALVARYTFTSDATDSSGYNHDATANTASLTQDRFGRADRAYSFNGSQSITLPDTELLNSLNEYTFSFWAKFDPTISNVTLIGKGSHTIKYHAGSDNIHYYSGTARADTIEPPVDYNYWQHIAVSRSSTGTEKMKIYLNGAKVSTFNSDAVWPDSGHTTLGNALQGSLDDVLIYSRVLDSNEIKALRRQPNKHIFVTDQVNDGDFDYTYIESDICTEDANAPADALNKDWKLMLYIEDNTNDRIACTNANCSGGLLSEGQSNWVLRGGVTYINNSLERIATANDSGIFSFPLVGAPSSVSTQVWMGFDSDWLTGFSCKDGTSWNTNSSIVVYGSYGLSDSATSDLIYSASGQCNDERSFICVEQ